MSEERRSMRRSSRLAAGQIVKGVAVTDEVFRGMSVRVYRPSVPGLLPWVVYLHGGGWVVGDLDTHDSVCRRLCAESNHVIVSLAYPLAPERPFPHAIDTLLDLWPHLVEHGGQWRTQGVPVLGGDSAGGNLSLALAVLIREADLVLPDGLMLIYPGVDMRCRMASHRTLSKGYILTGESIDWYLRNYAAPVEDVRASPIEAASMEGLPPTLVTTAGFDPLRDEGEWLVQRLRDETHVAVVHQHYPSLVHGYAHMDGMITAADGAMSDLGRWLIERERGHGDRQNSTKKPSS
ncbi:MAG: alpha/beta hydrolase, partial [Verrucomicrobia bacterium]|nr:alpha/beta hydrolase [Verrucomicrobiota bacterium]